MSYILQGKSEFTDEMCPRNDHRDLKAYYVADDVYEIELPEHLENLPALGDIEESGIIGYIIIANGEEITIITDEEAYLTWKYDFY